jgi:hypothetical protein
VYFPQYSVEDYKRCLGLEECSQPPIPTGLLPSTENEGYLYWSARSCKPFARCVCTSSPGKFNRIIFCFRQLDSLLISGVNAVELVGVSIIRLFVLLRRNLMPCTTSRWCYKLCLWLFLHGCQPVLLSVHVRELFPFSFDIFSDCTVVLALTLLLLLRLLRPPRHLPRPDLPPPLVARHLLRRVPLPLPLAIHSLVMRSVISFSAFI